MLDKRYPLSFVENFNRFIDWRAWSHDLIKPSLCPAHLLTPVPWSLDQIQIQHQRFRDKTLRRSSDKESLDPWIANFNIANYVEVVRFWGHCVQPCIPVFTFNRHFSIP